MGDNVSENETKTKHSDMDDKGKHLDASGTTGGNQEGKRRYQYWSMD